MRLEDFIHHANLANSIEELTTLYSSFLLQFGFEFVLCSEHDDQESHTVVDIVHGLPVHRLGTVHHPRAGVVEAPTISKTSTQAQITEGGEISLYRHRAGIHVAVPHRSGKTHGISVVPRVPAVPMGEALKALLYAVTYHYCVVSVSMLEGEPQFSNIASPLTPKECECLIWLARGRTKSDAAQEMKVSISCIKRYCESSYDKLGVHNLPSAIAVAIHKDYINPF